MEARQRQIRRDKDTRLYDEDEEHSAAVYDTEKAPFHRRHITVSKVACLRAHVGCVWAAAWRPDGLLLASCGADRRICLWGISTANQRQQQRQGQHRTQKRQQQPSQQQEHQHQLNFESQQGFPEGEATMLTAGGPSASAWRGNKRSSRRPCSWTLLAELDTTSTHKRTLRCVSWSPDSDILAIASFDATVSLWKITPKSCINSVSASTSAVQALLPDTIDASAHADRKNDAISSSKCSNSKSSGNNELSVRSVEARCVQILEGHEHEVKCVAWSRTGQYLATCSRDKCVWIYERSIEDGLSASILNSEIAEVKTKAKAPAAGEAAEGEEASKTTTGVEAPEGAPTSRVVAAAQRAMQKVPENLSGSDRSVQASEYSSSTTNSEEDVFLGRSSGNRSQAQRDCRRKAADSLASEEVDTGNSDSELAEHVNRNNAEDEDEEGEFVMAAVLQGHTQDVKAVRWHPFEDVCISASYDDTFRVWGLVHEGGGEWGILQVVCAHKSTVWCLSFDRLGSRLATCSDDRSLRIWTCLQNEPSQFAVSVSSREKQAGATKKSSLSSSAVPSSGVREGTTVAAALLNVAAPPTTAVHTPKTVAAAKKNAPTEKPVKKTSSAAAVGNRTQTTNLMSSSVIPPWFVSPMFRSATFTFNGKNPNGSNMTDCDTSKEGSGIPPNTTKIRSSSFNYSSFNCSSSINASTTVDNKLREESQAVADEREKERAQQRVENWRLCAFVGPDFHTRPIYYVDWHPKLDVIVTASGDNALRFFSCGSDDSVNNWSLEFIQPDAHYSDVNCAVWSPVSSLASQSGFIEGGVNASGSGDQALLASTGDDGHVRIWSYCITQS